MILFIHTFLYIYQKYNTNNRKNIDTVKEKHTNSDMCSPTRIGYGLESYNSGGLIWYNNMTRMRAISVNENASFMVYYSQLYSQTIICWIRFWTNISVYNIAKKP